MDQIAGVRVAGLSRWFKSAPVPASDQPWYINAVALLLTETAVPPDPAWLLGQLMRIETECGRQRGALNAARTLDLDIIGIDSLVRTAPDPVLPHPRAHLRAFVLAPLEDVAPGWVHPVVGVTARTLLAALADTTVTVLE